METNRDLWVFVETREDGSARDVSIELLGPGRDLAREQGGKLVAVVIGCGVKAAVEAASRHGADQVLFIDSEEFRRYSTDAYVAALDHLLTRQSPAVLLLGATPNGRDLAPRLASRLDTGLVSDCTGMALDRDTGCVLWSRPSVDGSVTASVLCPTRRPQLGTVRPGVFPMPQAGEDRAEVTKVDFTFPTDAIRTELLEVLPEESAGLEQAPVLVAGGRGVGGPQGFALLRQLADALGGQLCATQAAVEEGWISPACQVGLTGKTVRPRLYIACGISGAGQHLAGMRDAETIVAINRDPNAPIFSVAHYGVVGDLFEVLPAFLEQLRDRRSSL